MKIILFLVLCWRSRAILVRNEVELQDALNSITCLLSGPCAIKVESEILISQEISVLGEVVLTGNGEPSGKLVSNGGGHALMNIAGSLTTYNISFVGNGLIQNDGGCLRVSGSLFALDGTTFTECSTLGNGGGVFINSDTAIVSFKNMFAYNCLAYGSGGFLYNSGLQTIQLENVLIDGCIALSTDFNEGGGAVYSIRGRIDLLGYTKISNCLANQDAGAILAFQVSMRDQTLIKDCTSGAYGGGVYAQGSFTIRDHARITQCTASQVGGCSASLDFEATGNSSLDNCNAGFLGGGVFAFSSASFYDHAAITHCSAYIGGCAAFGSDPFFSQAQSIMAGNSSMSYCTSGFGGGIGVLSTNSHFQLEDYAKISDCYASLSGGGIYVFQASRVTLREQSSVHDCTAGIAGGAIDANGGSNVSLYDSASVYNCIVIEGQGGGISLVDASSISMSKNSRISSCAASTSAGCLFLQDGSSAQIAGMISSCSADSFGGAVVLQYRSELYLLPGGKLQYSTAGSFGGGVHGDQAYVNINKGATIVGCTSSTNGGGISAIFNSTVEFHGKISHCMARRGGGIYHDESHVTVTGSILSSIASDEGGCLYSYFFSRSVLSGAWLEACRAQTGAGIYSIGASALIDLKSSSIITGCSASEKGGGLALTAGHLRMDSNAMIQNCTADKAGGVHLEASALMINGGRISQCTATSGAGFLATSKSRIVMINNAMIDMNSAIEDGGGGIVQDDAVLLASVSCAYVIVQIDLSEQNIQLPGDIWIAATPLEAKTDILDTLGTSTYLRAVVGTSVARELCLVRGITYLFGLYASQPFISSSSVSATIEVVELGVTNVLSIGQGQFATDVEVTIPNLVVSDETEPLISSNKAGARAGGLAILQGGHAFITESNFTNNSATGRISRDGGAGALLVDDDGEIQLTKVNFYYNKAPLVSGGALESASKLAQVLATSCAFFQNSALTAGGAARIRGPASFYDCTFDENSANEGGSLSIDSVPSSVTVVVDNSSFTKNKAVSKNGAGGALAVRAAESLLSGGLMIQNNEAIDGADGGGLALRDTSQSTVTFQVETSNYQNVLVIVDWRNTTKQCRTSTLIASNATCDSLVAGCAAVRPGPNDFFSSFPADMCDGCACHGRDERYVEISLVGSTSFWRCEPRSGALHECDFLLPVEKNNEYQVKIIDTLGDSFWGGEATVLLKQTSQELAALSPADIDGFESKVVTFSLQREPAPVFSITGSRALLGAGGSLSVDDGSRDSLPINYDAVYRKDNIALYGDDVATPSRTLRFIADIDFSLIAASGFIDTRLSPIAVEVVDGYGQRALTETGTSAASISILSEGNATVANSEKLFERGVARFDSALFTDRPGSIIEIEISSSSLQSLTTNRVNATLQFRDCEAGEIVDSVTESTFRCALCLRGEYWYENECFECEPGMVCNEAGLSLNLVQADKGRYRFTETSDRMYKCPSGGTGCPGGSGVGQDLCKADGYLGALCGTCARGWFQSRKSNSQQKCTKCNHDKRVLAGTVLISVCFILFIFIEFCIITTRGQNLVRRFIGEANTYIDEMWFDEMSFLAGFKILFAFYQMLGAIPTVFPDLILPSSYTRITSMMGTVSGLAFSNVLPTRCLFGDVSNYYYYIASHQLTFWLPIVSIGIVLVSAYFLCSDNLFFVANSHDPRVTYQVAFLIIYILTPTCTLVMTSSLSCEKFDYGEDSDESFLRAAMDIGCHSNRYKNIIRPLGILGVLVYPTLIVLGYIGILVYYHKAIEDDGDFMESWQINENWLDGEDPTPEQQQDLLNTHHHNKDAAKRRLRRLNEDNSGALYFAFLWTNYSTQRYYWDLMEVLRRIFLTALISFVAPGSRLQVVIALFVSVVYGYMHSIIQPRLNLVEHYTASVTDICLSITYFITLLLRTNIGLSKRSAFAQAVLVVAAFVPLLFEMIVFCTTAQQRKSFLYCLCCRSSDDDDDDNDRKFSPNNNNNGDTMCSQDSALSIGDGTVSIGILESEETKQPKLKSMEIEYEEKKRTIKKSVLNSTSSPVTCTHYLHSALSYVHISHSISQSPFSFRTSNVIQYTYVALSISLSSS